MTIIMITKKNKEFIRKHIKISIIIALCFFVFYTGICFYNNYYSYTINISLVYPGIEEGLYPNGERFMMYDFIDVERIEETLMAMRKKGWYTDITSSDLLKNLNISEYLRDLVQERVNSSRIAGEDFSYYSNEYMLSFTQPNIINPKKLHGFFGLIQENHAKDFLEELVKTNLQYIMNNYLDNKEGFYNLTKSYNKLQNDYSDIVDYYNRSIVACASFLYEKEAEGKAYTSPSTGESFKKLIVSYQNLMDTDVSKLLSYVKANRLTKSIQHYENRNKVILERLSQNIQRSSAESMIAKDAMGIYDHTFTKHIVIVAQNEEDGLYQAHPKTGYDTIVQRVLSASVNMTESQENHSKISDETTQCIDAYYNNPEYPDLLSTADKMVKDIEERYNELNNITVNTLDEYLYDMNSGFVKTTVKKRSLLSWREILNAFIVFISIQFIVFLVCIINERTKKEKNRMERLINSIQL